MTIGYKKSTTEIYNGKTRLYNKKNWIAKLINQLKNEFELNYLEISIIKLIIS